MERADTQAEEPEADQHPARDRQSEGVATHGCPLGVVRHP